MQRLVYDRSGQGVGVVLLRPAGDQLVRCTVRAASVNNDGASKASFQHPSEAAQAALLVKAWKEARVGPQQLSMIECHGTGTRIGDPIEVAALAEAFRRCGSAGGSVKCSVIGSVKSNVGHTGAAAGVLGLLKACLALQHSLIPASLHCRRINPDLHLGSSPFALGLELQPFHEAHPFAAVSSFGLGGTNAHAVLEAAAEGPWEACEPSLLERRVYWHAEAKHARVIKEGHGYPQGSWQRHPMLVDVPWINERKEYHCQLRHNDSQVNFLWQHQVNGSAVFPGASFIELFVAIGQSLGFVNVCLEDVSFESPLFLGKDDSTTVCNFCVVLSQAAESYEVQVTDLGHRKTFARALLNDRTAGPLTMLVENDLREVCVENIYSRSTYGLAFRTVQSMQMGTSSATARLAVCGEPASDFCFHPSLLDGAFQVMLGKVGDSEVWPRSVKRLHFFHGPVALEAHVQAEWKNKLCGSFKLSGSGGTLWVEGLLFAQRGSRHELDASNGLILQQRWELAPTPQIVEEEMVEPGATCVTFGKTSFFSSRLVHELRSRMDVRIARQEVMDESLGLSECAEAMLQELLSCATSTSVTVLFCGESGDDEIPNLCKWLLALVKALLRMEQSVQLLVLTADGMLDQLSLARSTLVGLCRAIQRECPQLNVLHIDWKSTAARGSVRSVAEVILKETRHQAVPPELGIMYNEGHRYVCRFGCAEVPIPMAKVELQGAYLITGGLGALGLKLGEWLSQHGVSQLILASRGRSRESIPEDVEIEIYVERGDVTDRSYLRKIFQKHTEHLKGLIHAAGILCDRTISSVTWEDFATVFQPKAKGAELLHLESQQLELVDFVLMSSTASLLGSIGQASYAAANSFLDGLAAMRRQRGLPGLSINWGPWAEVGMAKNVTLPPGMRRISVKDALDAFGQARPCLSSLIAFPSLRGA